MAVSAWREAFVLDLVESTSCVQWLFITKRGHYKDVKKSNKNELLWFDYNKNRLEGLTIRYIGTLVHIAALRRDLSFLMR